MQQQADQFMNERAAAEYLGLSPSALRTHRRLGIGPAFYRFGQKLIKYHPQDLNDYVKRVRQDASQRKE